MEIRTASKTLPSSHFNGPEGIIPGNTFTPVTGVDYEVVKDIEIEGTKVRVGCKVRKMFSNKKHMHLRVV